MGMVDWSRSGKLVQLSWFQLFFNVVGKLIEEEAKN